MRSWMTALVRSSIVAAAPSSAAPSSADDDAPLGGGPRSAQLAALAGAFGCDVPTALDRVWCIVARGWEQGAAAPIPAAAALPGLRIRLHPEWTMSKSRERARFVELGMRRSGEAAYAEIRDVWPDSHEERAMLADVVDSMRRLHEQDEPRIALPDALARHLATLPARVHTRVRRSDQGWTSHKRDAAMELRRVGPYWVAIEAPYRAPGAFWLSVFVDVAPSP